MITYHLNIDIVISSVSEMVCPVAIILNVPSCILFILITVISYKFISTANKCNNDADIFWGVLSYAY